MNWTAWIKQHRDELEANRGYVLLVHPEHGILLRASSKRDLTRVGLGIETLREQAERVLKRSVRKQCCYVNVDTVLQSSNEPSVELDKQERKKPKKREVDITKGWTKKRKKGAKESVPQLTGPSPDPHNNLPNTTPLVDPFDNDAWLQEEAPGAGDLQAVTVSSYAAQHGLAPLEALIWVLDLGKKGAHLHTLLDADDVYELDRLRALKQSKATGPTKTGVEYWTGKPKHEQPEFQPVPFDPYDSNVVIDSAGKMGQRLRPPGRGGTYD